MSLPADVRPRLPGREGGSRGLILRAHMFGQSVEHDELLELPELVDGVVAVEDEVVVVADDDPVAACVIAAAPPAIVPAATTVARVLRSRVFIFTGLLFRVCGRPPVNLPSL